MRVFRSSNIKNSKYAPAKKDDRTTFRYDGLYTAELCVDSQGQKVDEIPCGDMGNYCFTLTRSNSNSNLSNEEFCQKIDNTQSKQTENNPQELKAIFLSQQKKRKTEGWLPEGRRGRTPPLLQQLMLFSEKDSASCPRYLKKKLPGFIDEALMSLKIESAPTKNISRLSQLRFPHHISSPNDTHLKLAHDIIGKIIPSNDYECFEAIQLANKYCMHWKPQECKVVLLCESHAHTPQDLVVRGPKLKSQFLPSYEGPREYVAHVNCIGYGENDSLTVQIPNNKGSNQFWRLISNCARGYDYIESGLHDKHITKGGNDVLEERLKLKLDQLQRLRDRGIWIVDTNLFGWYITQETKHTKLKKSGEVVKKQRERPDPKLKDVSLVLSWELFTKHLLHTVAREGNLKFIMPIGKSVANALTKERLQEVIDVDNCRAVIEENPPAPDSWVIGGYDQVLKRISSIINSHNI